MHGACKVHGAMHTARLVGIEGDEDGAAGADGQVYGGGGEDVLRRLPLRPGLGDEAAACSGLLGQRRAAERAPGVQVCSERLRPKRIGEEGPRLVAGRGRVARSGVGARVGKRGARALGRGCVLGLGPGLRCMLRCVLCASVHRCTYYSAG